MPDYSIVLTGTDVDLTAEAGIKALVASNDKTLCEPVAPNNPRRPMPDYRIVLTCANIDLSAEAGIEAFVASQGHTLRSFPVHGNLKQCVLDPNFYDRI